MPELPEVETIARQLRPLLVQRTIRRVIHASPLMAISTVGSFKRSLRGRRIEALHRQGKWMFYRLSDGRTLVIHLGMTGRLGVVEAKTPVIAHVHLRLELDDGGEELRFADPRRFGELLLLDPRGFRKRFGPDRLGPDALELTAFQLCLACRSRRAIKAVLLDQSRIAGIGNIYADEILFDAGVAPGRIAISLTESELRRLSQSLRRVLTKAIRFNGTSIRDYVTGAGVPGEFQDHLRVYGRANQSCKKCSMSIELSRSIIAGRATHWCPVCQPGHKRVPKSTVRVRIKECRIAR